MSSVLVEIIELLTSGLTQMATGIGEGLQSFAQSIFLETAEGGDSSLSVFGGLIIIFAGISLAVGLGRLVFNWLTSLGN